MCDSISKCIRNIFSKVKIYSQHFFEGIRKRVFIETFFNLKFLSFDSESKDGVGHCSEITNILIVSELDLIQMRFYKQVMTWTLVIQ